MKFRADVAVFSRTADTSKPLTLRDAEVEMTYDYENHVPGLPIIVQKLVITPVLVSSPPPAQP